MKLKRWKAILCTLVMTLMCFGVTIPAKAAEQTGEKHQEDNANSFRYKNGEPIGNEDVDHLSSPQELNTISYMGSYLKSSVLTKGIDVSTHNGSVDWKQVKNSGLVDFVIIRCGYGDDYTHSLRRISLLLRNGLKAREKRGGACAPPACGQTSLHARIS